MYNKGVIKMAHKRLTGKQLKSLADYCGWLQVKYNKEGKLVFWPYVCGSAGIIPVFYPVLPSRLQAWRNHEDRFIKEPTE
jgi:hypothetical protein